MQRFFMGPGDRAPLTLLEAIETWLARPDRRATRRVAELMDEMIEFQRRLDRHLRRTLGGYLFQYGDDGEAMILCFLVVHEAGSSVARVRPGHVDPDVGLIASLYERLHDAEWEPMARALSAPIRQALLRNERGLERL